jgi:hypothetical protein
MQGGEARACFKTLRSSLTLLKKEGTEPFKVPLFKGDLGGSLQNQLTSQKVLKHALVEG